MVLQMDNFLDIYDIWVNELIGDVWITIFLGLILIWYMTIKTKMPTEISLIFAVIYLAAMYAKTGFTGIWVFTVLGVGFIFYYKLQKVIRQG